MAVDLIRRSVIQKDGAHIKPTVRGESFLVVSAASASEMGALNGGEFGAQEMREEKTKMREKRRDGRRVKGRTKEGSKDERRGTEERLFGFTFDDDGPSVWAERGRRPECEK